MATAEMPAPRRTANPARWRRRRRGAAIAVLVLAAALALVWPRLRSYATLAASYGAHVACTCHYIGGRPLKDCRHDFERGMGVVTLSADEPARRVTARYLFLARQSATLADGAGCLLEPWRG